MGDEVSSLLLNGPKKHHYTPDNDDDNDSEDSDDRHPNIDFSHTHDDEDSMASSVIHSHDHSRCRDCHSSRGLCFLQLVAAVTIFTAIASLSENPHDMNPFLEGSDGHNNDKDPHNHAETDDSSSATVSESATFSPNHNCKHYRKHTLQLARELPFSTLFADPILEHHPVPEAMAIIHKNVAVTVASHHDSHHTVSQIYNDLTPLDHRNHPILWKNDTDYYSNPTFDSSWSVVEDAMNTVDYQAWVVRNDDDVRPTSEAHVSSLYTIRQYHPPNQNITSKTWIQSWSMLPANAVSDTSISHHSVKDGSWVVTSTTKPLPTEFPFENFAGAVAVRDEHQLNILLGLETKSADKTGDPHTTGTLVAMRSNETHWATFREIALPSWLPSRIDSIRLRGDRILLLSQESSQVWIGKLQGRTIAPTSSAASTTSMREEVPSFVWNISAVEFPSSKQRFKVYDFPKDHDCATTYCNVVDVDWINDKTLLAVSGKMKHDQDFRCFDKQQSVHMFVLPKPIKY